MPSCQRRLENTSGLETPVQTDFSAQLPIRRARGGNLLIGSDRSYGLFIWWLYFVPPTQPGNPSSSNLLACYYIQTSLRDNFGNHASSPDKHCVNQTDLYCHNSGKLLDGLSTQF